MLAACCCCFLLLAACLPPAGLSAGSLKNLSAWFEGACLRIWASRSICGHSHNKTGQRRIEGTFLLEWASRWICGHNRI